MICVLAALAAGTAAAWLNLADGAVAPAVAPAVSPSPAATPDALEQFRLEREQMRAMHAAQYQEVIYADAADEQTRQMAREAFLDALKRQEQELTIEGILRSRGYADALASVEEGAVSVLVRAGQLSSEQSAVIYELVLAQTGVSGDQVKIIPIN